MLVSPFYDTAPEHASERAMASYALLDSLHIPYQRIEHEKAETMEVCAAVSDALGVRICKNLFLCNRQQTSFYLLTMPEDKPFHTKDLSHQIGSDRDVYTAPYFACHPCDNTQSLKFKTEDLLNVLLPKIGHEPIIVEL